MNVNNKTVEIGKTARIEKKSVRRAVKSIANVIGTLMFFGIVAPRGCGTNIKKTIAVTIAMTVTSVMILFFVSFNFFFTEFLCTIY